MKHPVLMLLLGSFCLTAQQTNSSDPKALPISLSSVVLSRVCTPSVINRRPAADSEFLTTDPMVCIFFEYNGGHKGDKIRVDWLNPLGTVVRSDRSEQPEDGYRWWQWTLPIAGQLGSFAPGDWKVSVFWNDMGIAALPFRISVPPDNPIEMISKTLLPSGTVGLAYSYNFKVRGGEGPYRWNSTGALPPGLSLSADGVLSGTPTRRDGFAFTVTATDQAKHTLTRRVGIGIGPATNVTVAVRALMDHKSSSGCAQGPPLSEFRAGQGEVWLEFMVNGGKAGEVIEDNWFDATGEQVGRGWYRQKEENQECFRRRYRIGADKEPGDWRVRVLWNGGEAFSIPFRVTSAESTSTHPPAPGRYALLIGNTEYRNLPPIPSAAGDVDLLGSALKQVGFDVTLKKNLTSDDWKRTEREFMSKVDKDSVVVVYFSGYSLHEDSDNRLVPVSFNPSDSGPLSTKAYSVDRMRQLLEEKNVKLKVFLLNAGWSAAALDRQTEKAGLATPEVDAQTIFSFSVEPGRTLPVDTERTSLFARTLADLVNKSGSDISQLLTVELPQREAASGGAPMTLMDKPQQFRFSNRPMLVSNGTGSGGGIGSGASNGLGAGAYKIGGGVSAPVPTYKPEPMYAEEARKAKLEGTVVLAIVIDENGNVRDTKVVRPLGLGLDEKAIEAVRKWKFRPGMKDGRPVPVQATIQVNFRLLDKPKNAAGEPLSGKWSIRGAKFDLPPGAQGPRLLKASLDQLPRMGYSTDVTVTLEIDAEGSAQNVEINAPPPFDIAPVLTTSIRNWSFAAAQQDGKPIAVHGSFHLSYQAASAVEAMGDPMAPVLPAPPPMMNSGGPEPPSVHVGADTEEAKLVHKVTPVYPPLAQQARVQGTVLFAAIIAKDGTVRELKLITGHPLLVAAAETAVKQWQYRPTLLNGEPVEVRTTIQVNFTLSQ